MAKKCMSCGGSMNKMAKGGNTSDNPRLERLATKVNKKTAAGKPATARPAAIRSDRRQAQPSN